MSEARCMKCRKQVPITDGREEVTKNKMRMLKGVCGTCGTKVCRILGKVKDGDVANTKQDQGTDEPVHNNMEEPNQPNEEQDNDWE